MKSPITWFGGKGLLLKELLPRIPEHLSYVEVFGGGAHLLFAKPRSVSQIETYNDLDEHLVEFFRAIQNDIEREILIDRWQNMPYSRAEYDRCRQSWRAETDRLERIYQWFILARQSFAARFSASWGFSIRQHSGAITYKNIVNQLYAVGDRIKDWQIDNKDWSEMLDTYDSPDTFFYLDPPYVTSTRKSSSGYAHEMSDDDHQRLIERIQTLKGKVMLSGYNNPLYEGLPWRRADIPVTLSSAGRTRTSNLQGVGAVKKHQTRIESIWCNYDTHLQLNLF